MIKQILDLGMLHGTTFGNLGAILRQGLRPHAGYSPHQTKTLDAVFLTDSPEAAMMYATSDHTDLPMLPYRQQPVVLQIDATGLPLEPDYDDAGMVIEIDHDDLNFELAQRDIGPIAIGQPVPAQVEDIVDEVIDTFANSGSDRPEPYMLEVINGTLVVSEPYVRIGLPHDALQTTAGEVYYEVDHMDWQDGTPYMLARQWMCFCSIPYDRITGVYVPQWLPSMLGLQPKQVLEHANWLDPGMLLETGDVDWPYAWRQVPMIRLPKPALDALLKRRTTLRKQG